MIPHKPSRMDWYINFIENIYKTYRFSINMKNRKTHLLIVIFTLIALIFSIIILVEHNTRNKTLGGFCSITGNAGNCTTVQDSFYGKFLGIDLVYFGVIGFSILCILNIFMYFFNNKYLLYITLVGCGIAGLAALWLLYIQSFILKTFCIYCLFVDISSVILLILGVYILFQKKL
jgi:uncharacterized membrane protein